MRGGSGAPSDSPTDADGARTTSRAKLTKHMAQQRFETFMGVVILLNSVLTGIEVSFKNSRSDWKPGT